MEVESGLADSEVAAVFDNYPGPIRRKLLELRRLVLETAAELEDVAEVEEALKWGEPSFLTKTGSTIRLGWKRKDPRVYAIYFNCHTKLVETFRELYSDSLSFEGNRAIVFDIDDDLPKAALQHCVSLALRYHRLKHLPLLGS